MSAQPGAPGRHRRPPPKLRAPQEATELQRRAVTEDRPVEETGVFTAGGVPFWYREEYLPDGTVRRYLVRLDSTLPFPPPDPR